MANITIRNIPNTVLSRIRTISELEKRSLNSELLILIERGLNKETENRQSGTQISRESQIKLWKALLGEWEDDRSTEEIIEDIYSGRTYGRDIEI